MKERGEQIAEWARQMGVSEEALREFLSGLGTPYGDADPMDSGTQFFDPNATVGFAPSHSAETPNDRIDTVPLWDADTSTASNRYEDLGLLGVGGMGEVRRVRDVKLRRTMAMKIIHKELMSRSRLASRFIEEAQVVAQLQHPNIVPVHDIGQLADGRHYFTMQQIRGSEFTIKIQAVHTASSEERWRPASDGTSFRDLIRIHQQVCETVAYAHAQGVIHRDLKPENIMIGAFGAVLVVDWGLAKVLGRDESRWDDATEETVETDRSSSNAMQTRVGTVAGTPCYMAPEQAFGQTDEVGKATDVYTLGAILYEILSGLPPYRGDSAQDVLEQVKTSEPPKLLDPEERTSNLTNSSEVTATGTIPAPVVAAAKIPEPLAAICEAAMVRSVPDRTISAQEMALELKAWLEGAEKRDKGLEEVATAVELTREAALAEADSLRAWQAADTVLTREGPGSSLGWEHWSKYTEASAEARRLRRRSERRLQAALVHAPSLEEAHEALARLRIDELVEATAIGDRPRQEALRQQLDAHLEVLGSTVRAELETLLHLGFGNVIAGHRYRRGALVGRHSHRAAVTTQVGVGARLLTLLGTAGVGKTRLALELAEDLCDQFSRTVFCDLSEASSALDVALRLSRSLDVRLRDADPVAHLAEVLATQPTLLVLDNLEQITAVIGPLCAEWVEASDTLQILATSRAPLGIPAESTVFVQPMSLVESLDLFVRRGQTIDKRFELSSKNREQLCDLVLKLDGLPLAIELAAARLNNFTLDELSERLTERFSLLRSRGRDAQALEGALDWSWGLLEPWAKAALSQASLFRGGFTLAAAEGVIRVGSDKRTPAMFDILGELVDNSLLRRDQSDASGNRYSLLESIRAYAHEKLGDPGDMGPELRGAEAMNRAQERHAAHFGQLGTADALDGLVGHDSESQWQALFRELDNLVIGAGYGASKNAALCGLAALKVLAMKGPVSRGVDLATQVLKLPALGRREQMLLEIERSRCLRISGRMDEARSMVDERRTIPPIEEPEPNSTAAMEVVETSVVHEAERDPMGVENGEIGESDEARELALMEAERLLELGTIERDQGRYIEAQGCFDNALKIFRRHANRDGEGKTLGLLGGIYRVQGQSQPAIAHYRQSIDISREVGNKRGAGVQLGNLGLVYWSLGELERAIECCSQSLAIAREIGNKHSEGIQLGNLGLVYQEQGQLERAIEQHRQALTIAREVGNKRGEGIQLGNIGNSYKSMGDLDQSIVHHNQAIAIAREVGDQRSEGFNFGNLGHVFVKLDRRDEAEDAFRRAVAACHETVPATAGTFRGDLALLLAQNGNIEEARSLIAVGEAQVADHAEEYTKFLCKKGQVCHFAGDAEGARAALEQAQQMVKDLKVAEDGDVGQALAGLDTLLSGSASKNEGEPIFEAAQEVALLEAERLMELGTIEYLQGRYAEARSCYEHAIGIFRSQGNQAGEARALGQLGTTFRLQGQMNKAMEYIRQSLERARDVGDVALEGTQLGNLGLVLQAMGQHDQALEYHRQAIVVARDIGNKMTEGANLGNLGLVYKSLGQLEPAIEYYEQAHALAKETGNKRSQAIPLANLANIYESLGQHDQAIACLTQAIDIARDIGDLDSESTYLGNLGLVFRSRGQLDRSIEYSTQALAIARKIGDQGSEGIHLGNLGDAYVQCHRRDEAETAFRKAIEICADSLPVGAGAFRGSLALLLAQRGEMEEAQKLLDMGEPAVQPYPEEYAKFLCKKGHVLYHLGNLDSARSVLMQAQGISGEIEVSDNSELGLELRALSNILGTDLH